MTRKRLRRIGELLLENSNDRDPKYWPWLHRGKRTSKKDANKFMLLCILNYRIPVERVKKNACRFAEKTLGDPDDLWECITKIPQPRWNARRRELDLHWLQQAHERVWKIGRGIVEEYGGDARKIWRKKSRSTVLDRLCQLGVGEQLSRMIVGALLDTEKIQKGTADVKVDTHVRRVLGRILEGQGYEKSEESVVLEKTRSMHQNPWQLDRPLYTLGKKICEDSAPRCSECYLREDCRYHQAIRL